MGKKTDIVKPQDIQEFHLQLALKIVRLKDLKCLPYSLNSVDLLLVYTHSVILVI